MTAIADRPLTDRARDVLKRAGNPFRNYFARNPDDEVCARYHVPELFAPERDLLLGVVDLYRTDPATHSEIVPVLGNKGAGKTHLLHSIKHGAGGAWQLLVTPGVYQRDSGLKPALPVRKCVTEAGMTGRKAFELVSAYVERTEAHNTAGLMRRAIYQGYARSVLLEDEADLANFLTFGFAELEFHVRPT